MALRDFTRRLRIFLDILEPKIESQIFSLGQTILKIWSHICENLAQFVHNITLKNG